MKNSTDSKPFNLHCFNDILGNGEKPKLVNVCVFVVCLLSRLYVSFFYLLFFIDSLLVYSFSSTSRSSTDLTLFILVSTRVLNFLFFQAPLEIKPFIITRVFNERYFVNYLSIVSEICYLLGCADPVSLCLYLKEYRCTYALNEVVLY